MLGREGKPLAHDADQLGMVMCDAAAGASQREARADDDGIAELCGHTLGLLKRVGEARARDLQADVAHGSRKELAVLALLDGVEVAADDLDPLALEHARLTQGDGAVERGLATHVGKQSIGVLALDHPRDGIHRDGLDIGAVGRGGVGHDGRRVGVDEDHLVALLAQGAAGLGAGIVELASLADHDGAGAYDQNLLDIGTLGH